MKRTIKVFLGQGLTVLHLDRRLLGTSAVIVAFHRVQPGSRDDGLTMPLKDFENYCRYFRDHFDVIGLQDMVARLSDARTLDRTLAITFDDGYRDNFEYAAPHLEKLGLPATFFVVSGWMDTSVEAWWDRENRTRQSWMTWNQVRTLQQSGFEIGAHTRSHVDLGAISPHEAWSELVGCRHQLERELGIRVHSFAYPYGRPENITPETRRLVREAGYSCCCAASGGVNRPGADPFHLQRVPIVPDLASPYQFGFDLALGRTELTA